MGGGEVIVFDDADLAVVVEGVGGEDPQIQPGQR